MTVLLLVLAAASPARAQPTESVAAVCTYVFDGDTIAVRLEGGREIRVRYAGIDAPEPDSRLGRQAAALNRQLVLDREITLRPAAVQSDPYGRFLASPEVCGIRVEEALLAAGLARRWRE